MKSTNHVVLVFIIVLLGFVAAKGASKRSALDFKVKEEKLKVVDILPLIKLDNPFENPLKSAAPRSIVERQNVLPVNDSFLQSGVVCSQYSTAKRSDFFEERDVNGTTGDISAATTDVLNTGTTGTTGQSGPIVPDPPSLSLCQTETVVDAGDDTKAHDVIYNPVSDEFVAVTISKLQETINNRQTVTVFAVVGYRFDRSGNKIGIPFFLVPPVEGRFPKDHIQLAFNSESRIFMATFEVNYEFGSEIWSVTFSAETYSQLTAQAYASSGTYDRFPQITYNPLTSAFLISWEFRNSVDLDTDTFLARVSDDGSILSAFSIGTVLDDRAPDVIFNPVTAGYYMVLEVNFGIYGFPVDQFGVPVLDNVEFLSQPQAFFLDHDPVLLFNTETNSILFLFESRLAGLPNNVIFQRKLNANGRPADNFIRTLVDQSVVPFASIPEPIYDPLSNHFIIFFDTTENLDSSIPNNNIRVAVVSNDLSLTVSNISQINNLNFNEHRPAAAVNPLNNKILVIWGHGVDVDLFVEGPVATADPTFEPVPFTTAAAANGPLTPEQTVSIVVPVLIAVGAAVAIIVFVGLMWWRRRVVRQQNLARAATELAETDKQRAIADT